MLNKFRYEVKLFLLKKKFCKLNKHNYTWITSLFDLEKVEIGKYTYGPLNIKTYGVNNEKLKIGSFCSIADNTTFLLAGEHSYDRVSTYPFKTKLKGEPDECFSKGKITIGDDVWIGYGATILSGVSVGQGAIIGANTVVAKDVPPYAIYVNGKIIKYRFNEKIINKLLTLNYEKIDYEKIDKISSLLYETITEENIDRIIKGLMNNEK